MYSDTVYQPLGGLPAGGGMSPVSTLRGWERRAADARMHTGLEMGCLDIACICFVVVVQQRGVEPRVQRCLASGI